MCWWNVNFLLNIKSRYFHKFLGERIGPLNIKRSRGSGLNGPCTLEK